MAELEPILKKQKSGNNNSNSNNNNNSNNHTSKSSSIDYASIRQARNVNLSNRIKQFRSLENITLIRFSTQAQAQQFIIDNNTHHHHKHTNSSSNHGNSNNNLKLFSYEYPSYPDQQQHLGNQSNNNNNNIERNLSNKVSSGSRYFIVSDYHSFFINYSLIKPTRRHHYEIIQENQPSNLYFDLEFKYKYNTRYVPNNTKQSENLLKLFRTELNQYLCTIYESINNKTQIDYCILDSSTMEKFSYHIIVIIDNHIFLNNFHIGLFVQKFNDYLLSTSTQSKEFIFNMEDTTINSSHTVNKVHSFIDLSVYSKNRSFRLFLSAKNIVTDKKDYPPLVMSSLSSKHIYRTTLEKQFLFSLVQYIHTTNPHLLSFPPNQDPQLLTDFQLNTAKFTSINGKSINNSFNHSFTGISPYPLLEKYLLNWFKSDGQNSVQIRNWNVSHDNSLDFTDNETGRAGDELKRNNSNSNGSCNDNNNNTNIHEIVLYNLTGTKFCYRIKREHQSNGVYILVYLNKHQSNNSNGSSNSIITSARFLCKCYDSECKSSGFYDINPLLFYENIIVPVNILNTNSQFQSIPTATIHTIPTNLLNLSNTTNPSELLNLYTKIDSDSQLEEELMNIDTATTVKISKQQ